jgi:DNA-binding Lrp family transcriptional regulator
MVKLDLKNLKILSNLDLNSRQSNSEIAKKVGLSKDSVGYRISKMEEEGIIRGYKTIIDTSKLGYFLYRIYFNLIDVSPQKIEELILFLKNEKTAWWIAKLDGKWNFVFAMWIKNNKEWEDFYYRFNLGFKTNIKEKLICPVINYKVLNRKYLTNSSKIEIKQIGDGEKESFDEIDLQILSFLATNARITLIEIAKKLKVDSMTIHHRIKNLEKKEIIKGYAIDINALLLDKDLYSVKINLNDVSQLKEIKNYILAMPEIASVTEAIGSYDLEFDLEVENSKKYFEIIEKLENKFKCIREITYFRILRSYNITYLPYN